MIMAERKEDTHFILKREDIEKYCSDDQIEALMGISEYVQKRREEDGRAAYQSYLIVNCDEPYASIIEEIILYCESAKDTGREAFPAAG